MLPEEKTDVIEGLLKAGCGSVHYSFAVSVSLEMGQVVTQVTDGKRGMTFPQQLTGVPSQLLRGGCVLFWCTER